MSDKPKMMEVDEDLIKYLEDLSFITLSAEERKRIAGDLENIIGSMGLLSALDTSDVLQMALSENNNTLLRKDAVEASFPREEILRNAPGANGKTFIVPQVVE